MSENFVVFVEAGGAHQDGPKVDACGPFPNEAAASAFIAKNPAYLADYGALEPTDGGYAEAHIINAETATDPETQLREWLEEEEG